MTRGPGNGTGGRSGSASRVPTAGARTSTSRSLWRNTTPPPKLGKFDVWELELHVKPNTDVAFPVVKLWVDEASGNVLKRQEFALSGRLMRTLYYPRWQKLYSESKKAEVWYPGEIRIYDEVEKENSTIVVLKSVDLRPLEANIFTKAWLEAKSR